MARWFADVDMSRPKPLIFIGNDHRHAAGALQDLSKLADCGPWPMQDDHHHGVKIRPLVQKIVKILKPFSTRSSDRNCPGEMRLHSSNAMPYLPT